MKALQLRQTLAQGFASGALAGFVYVFLLTLWEGNAGLWMVLNIAPPSMVVGSIIGVIEATSIWYLNRVTGIQLRAVTRVSVASVAATLIVVFVGVQTGATEGDLTSWLIVTMSFVGPPALIVGSNIRPLALFTFGSIAVRGDGFDELYESRSVLAIAGTLPLRFLSFGVAGFWLLLLAQQPKGDPPYIPLIIVGGLPLLYMGISVFLTFRSPGKLLLLLLGIGGNVPVVLGSLLSFSLYRSFHSMEDMLILSMICWAFLIAWAIFLITRLSVDTSELMPLSILPDRQDLRGRVENESCLF